MLSTTMDLLKAGLKADPSITSAERARILTMIRRNEAQPKHGPPETPAPCLLRRAEVARRLSISLRTVDNLPLKKFKLPGRRRAAGFLEADVNELLTGKEIA